MDTVIADEAAGIDAEAELSAEVSEISAEANEGRLLEEVALNALRFLADEKPTPGSGDTPKSGGKGAKSGEKPTAGSGDTPKTSGKKPKKASDKRSDADISAGKKKGRGKEQRTED